MKISIPYIIIAFLVNPVFTFAQNNVNFNNRINYVDSVIYYCEQYKNSNEVDTTYFYKAMEMLQKININRNSISSVESIAKDFQDENNQWISDQILETFIFTLCNSDNLELAIDYCKKLIYNYDESQNPRARYIALRALTELRIPLRKWSIPETFDYYASRLKVYLAKNDSSALAISYFCFGTTYRLTGLPDMTIYNLKKSTSYINKKDTETKMPLSGLNGWVNNMSVLGQMHLETGDYESAITYSQAAKDYKLNILNDSNVSFLNCNIAYAMLMMNEPDSVNDLLNSAIQMASDQMDYPSLVRAFEIKGQYFLALNQLDSAESSLLEAKKVMRIYNLRYFGPAGFHMPNYHLAKVRIFQNQLNEARKLLEQEINEIGSLNKETLNEQKLLIEVYNKLGDSRAADSTFKVYSNLQSDISTQERKNRSKSFEIEAKIEDAENTINSLVTEKKIADITTNYLIGIAVLLLIVVSIIFNRFKVTQKQKVIIEKEKKRSDDLLLNILPAEVAEELKDKGSAEAKHFDEVTVLFTDFKGFTQLSEKLSPSELIGVINECFSAFDHIMKKHNIEKIKTIGDAYMAAAGLPVSNKTHAEDIINAALEIQEFMLEHKKKKQAAGELFFEIRIGINTGAVVAGIVGIRKFAYDIWGDTVNTASRMESSGEVGKVNISGSTYELIKNKFKCIHRGKLDVKNKGQVDMYFVEQAV